MNAVKKALELLLVGTLPLICISCGPHMKIQPSVKPYKQQMPAMPAGTVPVQGRSDTFTAAQAKLTANPLKATSANLDAGKIYYGYYCLMCHGTDGRGNGPVGQSYIPKPADLTSSATQGLSDAELYSRMLTGIGHSPVMEQTVLPEHRWPLVLYIRDFKGHSTAAH